MITLDQAHLLAAINASTGIIKRNSIPILECVKLEAKGEWLTISASDLDTHITTRIPVETSGEWACCVRHAELRQFVSSLQDNLPLEIGLSKNRLLIKNRDAKIEFPTLPAIEFPTLSKVDTPIHVPDALDMLNLCKNFTQKASYEAERSGVYIGDGIICGANGSQMAFFSAPVEANVILPETAVPTICKLIAMDAELYVGETGWRVRGENLVAIGRVVDGNFPDIRRVAIEHFAAFTCERQELLDAVQAATVGGARDVILNASGDVLSISGARYEYLNVVSDVQVSGFCDASFCAEIGADNLRNALKNLPGENVEIGFDGRLISMRSQGRDDLDVQTMCLHSSRTQAAENTRGAA